MKVLISGASGVIGSELTAFLAAAGHEIARLVRGAPRNAREIAWDPLAGRLDPAAVEGFDAVVHLSGESVAEIPWNAAKKARIRDSRVKSTRLLAETLARLDRPPEVFACASAIGYYGDRGEETLDEASPPGQGFLAGVCRDWEAAAAPAAAIRTVAMRFGVVLSTKGGAMAQTLPLFRLGLGGRLGSGQQYVSWIAFDDVPPAVLRILQDRALRGPVNVTAPNPVTNLELTRITGRVLHRPAALPVPAFVLRLRLGEMADEMVLSSALVLPRRLLAAGHTFRFPDLEAALRHLLS